ncbi:MAG: hypothetical protein R3B07_04445 [Polyangiaceae bacterium]
MRKKHWAAWVVCGVGAWASLMCGPPSQPAVAPDDSSEADAAPSPPEEAGEEDETAGPSATTSAVSGELAVRASTPGKIQCETLDCDLKTQICCYDESAKQGRCLPRGSEEAKQCAGEDKAQRECDESADCGSGKACCRGVEYGDQCENLGERWACKPGKCGSEALSAEVCLAGAKCGERACVAKEGIVGFPREGFCPSEVKDIPCGSSKCGLGEACCYDPATKQGSCVQDSDACQSAAASGSRSLFWCAKSADCNAGEECFNATGQAMYQEFSCGTRRCNVMSAMLGPFLCATKADCPPTQEDGEGNVYKVSRCAPSASAPKGVRACEYR